MNRDSTVRRPAGSGTSPCAELNGPALAKDETFTTVPLDGPRTRPWQDALHLPRAAARAAVTDPAAAASRPP
ncbi:MAG: hypothetical protein MZW92_24260 [Comamonadaceae bacterium]|nr:hypothetical protein [Comamonadaceae bacterium]